MIHDCSPWCNCIDTPNENKAVIKFDNQFFEGRGRNKDESIEIALYKLFYNHFKLSSIHWSHYWKTNLMFSDPIPDHLLQDMKQRIEGKNLYSFFY